MLDSWIGNGEIDLLNYLPIARLSSALRTTTKFTNSDLTNMWIFDSAFVPVRLARFVIQLVDDLISKVREMAIHAGRFHSNSTDRMAF